MSEGNGVDSVHELRKAFRRQLVVRGLFSAILTLFLIFLLSLLTFDISAWWFQILPLLANWSEWIKNQNPWNFFFIIFILANAINYAKQIQGVFLDRHNAKILVKLSEADLQQSLNPGNEIGKRRAELNGRRRLLESLLIFEPLLWSIGSLILAFIILGHFLAAASLCIATVAIVALIPRMRQKFTNLRDVSQEEEEVNFSQEIAQEQISPEQLKIQRLNSKNPEVQFQRARERAEENLAKAADRMMTLINRPLVRIKIGWPVVAIAAAAVGSITISLITEMSSSGELPERATLLILLLALSSNSALKAAQHSEDLSFFSSALDQIMSSEDGAETL